jgi:hypothetical protein
VFDSPSPSLLPVIFILVKILLLLLLPLPPYSIPIFLFDALQFVQRNRSDTPRIVVIRSHLGSSKTLILSLISTVSWISPARFFNQLAQETDFSFDGIVFGRDRSKRAKIIDVTGER